MIDPKWFVRKVGFGLRPEEEIPADPLAWAFAQTDVLPLSVGIEDVQDLIADLEQALDKI